MKSEFSKKVDLGILLLHISIPFKGYTKYSCLMTLDEMWVFWRSWGILKYQFFDDLKMVNLLVMRMHNTKRTVFKMGTGIFNTRFEQTNILLHFGSFY